MNPRRIITDARSLGWTAPVRLAYEVSKKTGFHRLVFERLVPLNDEPPRLMPPFSVPSEVPADAAERALREAAAIAGGEVRIFGKTLDVGSAPNWHRILHQPGDWPQAPWWTLDIRSDARPGDVKWVWELGRHRHLVVLARAVHLAPSDERFRVALESHLESWIEQNPVEQGIHWYSNLEISLRAIAWLDILGLAGDQLDTRIRARMEEHLFHSGRHLVADLVYSLSTMRGNHLLGDVLGLVALGKAFGCHPPAARWAKLGDRIFEWTLNRVVRPDGSLIEDSVSYCRFVTEMMIVRVLLGDAPPSTQKHLAATATYLTRLGVLQGSIPQYGDWDEGRVLASANDPLDLSPTVHLSLALLGDGAPRQLRNAHDELAWYATNGTPAVGSSPSLNGEDLGGGMARASRGPFTIWLKAGSGEFHQHADLLSTSVRINGAWVVGDPGTGTYNGDRAIRDHFRSTAAHSALRVGGEDQLVPELVFRWRHRASGVIGEAVRDDDQVVLWGVHNAYRRLDRPTRVARVCLVRPESLIVADFTEVHGSGYKLSIPLHPEIGYEGGALVLGSGESLSLTLPSAVVVTRGSISPFDGWWSDTYGGWRPATRLELEGRYDSPVVWGVWRGDPAPIAPFRDSLNVGAVSLAVSWASTGARLRVTTPGGEETRFAGLAR